MLVRLGAPGDRLGGVYLNEILRTSRLLCHGNFSGCRGNIPFSSSVAASNFQVRRGKARLGLAI